MEYEDFLGILIPYKKLMEDFSELYSMGFNFMDGKYELEENASRMLDATLNSHFDEEGVEWIHWFMYENDWGEKDWSIYDETGKPICYSFESTWEVVKEHLKK